MFQFSTNAGLTVLLCSMYLWSIVVDCQSGGNERIIKKNQKKLKQYQVKKHPNIALELTENEKLPQQPGTISGLCWALSLAYPCCLERNSTQREKTNPRHYRHNRKSYSDICIIQFISVWLAELMEAERNTKHLKSAKQELFRFYFFVPFFLT